MEVELRGLARIYLSNEASGHTLQPADLVNEAYLRLIEWNAVGWRNRAHFYAVAAKMMRRVLVSRAIARRRQKRGGSAVLVSLTEAGGVPHRSADVIALDEALSTLAKRDDRKSRLVELRFFGGLSAEETAEVLGISVRTVHREWDYARAWLFRVYGANQQIQSEGRRGGICGPAPDGRSRRVLEPGRARASTYVDRRASLMIPPSNELHGDLGLPRGPEVRIWLGSIEP